MAWIGLNNFLKRYLVIHLFILCFISLLVQKMTHIYISYFPTIFEYLQQITCMPSHRHPGLLRSLTVFIASIANSIELILYIFNLLIFSSNEDIHIDLFMIFSWNILASNWLTNIRNSPNRFLKIGLYWPAAFRLLSFRRLSDLLAVNDSFWFKLKIRSDLIVSVNWTTRESFPFRLRSFLIMGRIITTVKACHYKNYVLKLDSVFSSTRKYIRCRVLICSVS